MWYFGWLFIFMMVLGIVCNKLAHNSSRTYPFLFWLGSISLLSGSMLWLIIVISYLTDVDSMSANEGSVVSDTTVIKSAALNSELHGKFILGCGSVNQNDVYKFYAVVDSTGSSYKMQNVPVNKTKIKETEIDSSFVPKIVSFYYTEFLKTNNRAEILMLNRPDKEAIKKRILKEHVIYVPKGTIVDDLSKLNFN